MLKSSGIRSGALCAAALSLTLTALPAKAGIDLTTGLVGAWKSKTGTAFMIVSPDIGLLRIAGTDGASFFDMRCLGVRDQLHCRGGGAKHSGAGFIYESTFAMQPDGSMIEKWTAQEAAGEKDGEEVWLRNDPQSAAR